MEPFHSQVTRMRPELLRTARRRLRNAAWAEDAVSETTLAALQKGAVFTDPLRLRGWLFGILRHKLVDQVRQHLGAGGELQSCDEAEEELNLIGDPCPRTDPMRSVADRQFITALNRQLARLPQAHAEAFIMRECRGAETQEICDKLAISAGNLWVLLHRTRSRLRQTLADHRA